MKEYLKLLRFVKKQLLLLILAFFCMGFSTIFDGASISMIVPVADKVLTDKKIIIPTQLPAWLSNFVDRINLLEPFVLLRIIGFSVIILFIFKGLFQFLQGFLMNTVAQRAVRDVRNLLYKKLQGLSLDFYSQKRTGELISRLTNDVGYIGNALSYGLTDLIYQSMQVVMFSSIAFFIHTKLFLISFVVFPVVILPVVKVGRKIKKLSISSQESMADLNTVLAETIQGVRIVKGFSRENYEIGRFNGINRDYYKYILKGIKRTLLLSPFTEFVGAVAAIIIFILGGREVIEGRLSFGVFGLFLGSLLSMIRPFKKLSQVYSLNQQALAASKRIYAILDRKSTIIEKPEALTIEPPRQIIFDNIYFKYQAREDYVLKEINIKVNVPELIAIVGPTGSGKTTLLNLLPRFYDPTKGRVLFDDVDLKDIKLSSLRGMIGIVTQEMILFNDTVRANIGYGRLDASFEDIQVAAKKALAYDFIMKMPQGFDTIVGDRGFRLSGGEKQRICIARAILKNPKILLLDEATSQLDSESEVLVQKALNNLMEGKTVFVIAHRLSTVKNASRILVVQEGKIIKEGTHKELLESSDLYRKLYEHQFNF